MKKCKPMQNKKFKYVDDLAYAKCIDLTKSLRKANENEITRPVAYHSRTEHILPK